MFLNERYFQLIAMSERLARELQRLRQHPSRGNTDHLRAFRLMRLRALIRQRAGALLKQRLVLG